MALSLANGRLAGLILFFIWVMVPLLACSPLEAFALTADEQNTIAGYKAVSPSVVNITTSVLAYDFFLRPIPGAESGSGVIIKDDGTIVTNYHVVAEARRVEVTLADGSHWEARLVGGSPTDDLAVIRIDARGRSLVPVTLGDSSQLRVGEKILAIGNPFGLGNSLTVGVVSMTGRSLRHGQTVFKDLIQTDASINPGNSGGALVNSRGELIGINTAIISPTGSSVGVSFAIPVNRVKSVLPSMVSTWGQWLGWILAAAIIYWVVRGIYRI